MNGREAHPTTATVWRRWIITVLCSLGSTGSVAAYGWQLEVVDGTAPVGHYSSVTLDANERPHISYYDAGNGDLRYARRTFPGWQSEMVDSSGVVGEYTSLALDESGNPHISYHDDTNGNLKYACRDASGWSVQAVDSAGDVGEWTSLALDGGGYPHIAYYSTTAGNLKYAHSNGSEWSIETVDGLADVGRSASLALDDSGYPHIGYYDATFERLKYAYKDASGWRIEVVDSSAAGQSGAGERCSLALDAQGCPHIGYLLTYGVHYVRYARRSALGAWSSEVVAYYNMYPGRVSLALGQDDFPSIGYQGGSTPVWAHAWYAYKDSAWHSETVDGHCSDVSLTLAASGRPHLTWAGWAMGLVPVLEYACAEGFPIVLSGEVVEGELVLEWGDEPGASAYWVYGVGNQAHFTPGFLPRV